ncbi:hypothetical protein LDG_8611 [Legionella drancourtii LLAP12]|uniref:Uncharacterized protein n=1 Tax=Legionella drancourtii LLAP12 TaxID=658187 RepID=G9ETH9_9GAMM|nr:hypothetical protein LDG_8611 [Legionella drancourtii LLAP12]
MTTTSSAISIYVHFKILYTSPPFPNFQTKLSSVFNLVAD